MRSTIILSFVLTYIFSTSQAFAQQKAIPWDSTALVEIPAYKTTPATPLKSQRIYKGTYFSSSQGDDTDFTAFVPATFDISKTYSVVVFLGGGNGTKWQLPWALDSLAAELDKQEYQDYVIVSPDNETWSMWAKTPKFDGPQAVIELLDLIEGALNFSGRAFVVGHSNGGPGALNLAWDPNSRFKAAIAVSPTLMPWSPFQVTDQQLEDFRSLYATALAPDFLRKCVEAIKSGFEDEQYWAPFDPYTQVSKAKYAVPVTILTGAKDSLGFAKLSQDFVSAAKAAGVSVDYIEDSNRDHELTETTVQQMFNVFKSTP